jgi:shikimate kinase
MANISPGPLLVLIGFMGAGKSTICRLLAARLGCAPVDLDQEISRVHGPIPDLFANLGESGFRAIEHYQLDAILPTLPRPAVLALGGGAFLQPANRELLAVHNATVIFLDAPFDVIDARVHGSGIQRPLARDPEMLRKLYEQRRPTYMLADYTFPSTASEPAALVDTLVRLARKLGAASPARGTL